MGAAPDVIGGRTTVSRQGIAFNYSSPAELYLSRRRGRHTDYRRFATAAEAIRYAFEELRTRRSLSAWMEVGDEVYNKSEINRLYYPLSESLSPAPVRRLGATRLSVRIDLADGDYLGPVEMALLEAIQARKSIADAARSLGISYFNAWHSLDAINNALCTPAVAAEAGGHDGGRAVLTPVGMQFLRLYRAIEARAETATVAQRDALERLARSESVSGRGNSMQPLSLLP
jgi:molybdate transport system regulatory protein